MKLCVIKSTKPESEKSRAGVLVGENAVRLLPNRFSDVVDIIKSGLSAAEIIRLCETQETVVAKEDFLAPVQTFSKNVLCTGWNYHAHFEEGLGKRDSDIKELPSAPTFFTKVPSAIAAPFGTLPIDLRLSPSWDYEVEIAVVIGKSGRSIPQTRAMEHVFGYCLANDVSLRSLQRRHGGQWFRGKSIDDSTPLGPFVITADEVSLADVTLECLVNGEVRQSASARQMAFPLERLIAELSLGTTLSAGDVILTGTPAGVAMAMDPPAYLQPGDRLDTRSNVLGSMTHVMTATDLLGESDVIL